jgi:hypothetical protein
MTTTRLPEKTNKIYKVERMMSNENGDTKHIFVLEQIN